MQPESTLEVEGQSYPLIFSTNASYKLEKYLREEKMGTVGDLFKRLLDGTAGMMEVHQILWASLEGGRTRDVVPTRPNPYTIEEVGKLIDKMGGLIALAAIKMAILEAVSAAAPEPDPNATAAVAAAVGPNVQARGGNGKRSSPKRQKSGSRHRASGG